MFDLPNQTEFQQKNINKLRTERERERERERVDLERTGSREHSIDGEGEGRRRWRRAEELVGGSLSPAAEGNWRLLGTCRTEAGRDRCRRLLSLSLLHSSSPKTHKNLEFRMMKITISQSSSLSSSA